MDDAPKKKGRGRPETILDSDQVFRLARIGSTQQEIADYFGCSRTIIWQKYGREMELGKAAFKKTLRAQQMKRAMQGSDPMLIHLGKVYLDQKDKSGPAEDLDESRTKDERGNDIEP